MSVYRIIIVILVISFSWAFAIGVSTSTLYHWDSNEWYVVSNNDLYWGKADLSSYNMDESTLLRGLQYCDISEISNNADIDSIKVTFTIYNGKGSSNAKVYFVGADLSGGYASDWSAIESDTKYDSMNVGSSNYSYSRTFSSSTDLVQDFSDSLSSDDFDIAFYSTDAENSAGVFSFLISRTDLG